MDNVCPVAVLRQLKHPTLVKRTRPMVGHLCTFHLSTAYSPTNWLLLSFSLPQLTQKTETSSENNFAVTGMDSA